MDTVETPSPVDRLTITGAPSGDASEDPATSPVSYTHLTLPTTPYV